jgi:hypothetical protein
MGGPRPLHDGSCAAAPSHAAVHRREGHALQPAAITPASYAIGLRSLHVAASVREPPPGASARPNAVSAGGGGGEGARKPVRTPDGPRPACWATRRCAARQVRCAPDHGRRQGGSLKGGGHAAAAATAAGAGSPARGAKGLVRSSGALHRQPSHPTPAGAPPPHTQPNLHQQPHWRHNQAATHPLSRPAG